MGVDRDPAMRPCPVCGRTHATRAAETDYLRCGACGLLFATSPAGRYGEEYWEVERQEAMRREREDAFVRALELVWLSRDLG